MFKEIMEDIMDSLVTLFMLLLPCMLLGVVFYGMNWLAGVIGVAAAIFMAGGLMVVAFYLVYLLYWRLVGGAGPRSW